MLAMTKNVPVSEILIHKIYVVIPLKKQVDYYTSVANDSPKSLPVIKLGRVSDKLYLLSNVDIFYGIVESNLKSVDAEIIDFVNENEFVIEHVRLNKLQSGYNSLLLYGVVDYLSNFGISLDQSLKLLGIGNTDDQKLLELKLNSKAVLEMCFLYSYLAKKLSVCSIPLYISEYVSKYDSGKQVQTVKKIAQLIKSEKISDSKFAWPTTKSINILFSNSKSMPYKDDSAVAYPVNDIPESKDIVFAENLVKKSKRTIVIPATKNHPAYLVNKVTNTVSEISDNDTVITLVEMPIRPLYMFPKKAATQLSLKESTDDVKMMCFSNGKELEKILKKICDSKGVIFLK